MIRSKRYFFILLILILAAACGNACLAESEKKISYLTGLDGVFDRYVLVEEGSISEHYDPSQVGKQSLQMLDTYFAGVPAVRLTGYSRMMLSKIRMDSANPDLSEEELEAMDTMNGLRYSVNAKAMEIHESACEKGPSDAMKAIGKNAAGNLRELIVRSIRSKGEKLTLRQIYERLQLENYTYQTVFTFMGNSEAQEKIKQNNGAPLELHYSTGAIKEDGEVYVLHRKQDGTTEGLMGYFEQGLLHITLSGDPFGYYVMYLENAAPAPLKCGNEWWLGWLWFAAVILLIKLSKKKSKLPWILYGLLLFLSVLTSAFAILIPGCFKDAYVTILGGFAAYIVIRLVRETNQPRRI